MPTPALGAQTIGPTSGGKVTPVNALGTVAVQVIGPNQFRATITFHNPGPVDVFVASLLNAQGQSFTPTLAAPGGCFLVLAGGGTLVLTGECQGGYQAFARIASGFFTIMESNV